VTLYPNPSRSMVRTHARRSSGSMWSGVLSAVSIVISARKSPATNAARTIACTRTTASVGSQDTLLISNLGFKTYSSDLLPRATEHSCHDAFMSREGGQGFRTFSSEITHFRSWLTVLDVTAYIALAVTIVITVACVLAAVFL
jgi:hypothetical protein